MFTRVIEPVSPKGVKWPQWFVVTRYSNHCIHLSYNNLCHITHCLQVNSLANKRQYDYDKTLLSYQKYASHMRMHACMHMHVIVTLSHVYIEFLVHVEYTCCTRPTL